MKVLIIGANGQAGCELRRTTPVGVQATALSHRELDIVDRDRVRQVITESAPDLVINAAAYTDVDKAEQEQARAVAVNGDGAANIAAVAADRGIRLVHISTDFVFDGKKSRPYLPDDQPNPVSVYGASKLQGEQAVLSLTSGKALVVRTSWLYSGHGGNFAKTMLRLMSERDALGVVFDQVGTPTWARTLAKAIWQAAFLPEMQGIYHVADSGVASWYDFAVAIQEEAFALQLLARKIPVRPITTAEYPTPAKRPPYSVLDCTSIWKALGGAADHWRVSLRRMLQELQGYSSQGVDTRLQ